MTTIIRLTHGTGHAALPGDTEMDWLVRRIPADSYQVVTALTPEAAIMDYVAQYTAQGAIAAGECYEVGALTPMSAEMARMRSDNFVGGVDVGYVRDVDPYGCALWRYRVEISGEED